MDIRLFGRVLWRFKLIVLAGLAAAVVLSTLSLVRIDPAHGRITYRKHETWVSYTRLLVTQGGFQLGSTFSKASEAVLNAPQAAEGRLATLTVIYSNLITSDPVQRIMRNEGAAPGTVQAAAVPAIPGTENFLPIMSIAAFADSPRASRDLAAKASKAIRTFIEGEQSANGIQASERVQLQPVNSAGDTRLFTPRKKTLPIVIFLIIMLATVGLAFIL